MVWVGGWGRGFNKRECIEDGRKERGVGRGGEWGRRFFVGFGWVF